MTNEPTDTAANVAELGAHGASEKASSKKRASGKKAAPKGAKPAKGGKAKASAPKKKAQASKKATKTERAKPTTPRPVGKGATILAMIGRAKGATLAELMQASDWQAHSVRGFLSTAAKKHNVKIESTKDKGGERTYTVKG